jgi:hypothetical protein
MYQQFGCIPLSTAMATRDDFGGLIRDEGGVGLLTEHAALVGQVVPARVGIKLCKKYYMYEGAELVVVEEEEEEEEKYEEEEDHAGEEEEEEEDVEEEKAGVVVVLRRRPRNAAEVLALLRKRAIRGGITSYQ